MEIHYKLQNNNNIINYRKLLGNQIEIEKGY